jgi:hypothetical protein
MNTGMDVSNTNAGTIETNNEAMMDSHGEERAENNTVTASENDIENAEPAELTDAAKQMSKPGNDTTDTLTPAEATDSEVLGQDVTMT